MTLKRTFHRPGGGIVELPEQPHPQDSIPKTGSLFLDRRTGQPYMVIDTNGISLVNLIYGSIRRDVSFSGFRTEFEPLRCHMIFEEIKD